MQSLPAGPALCSSRMLTPGFMPLRPRAILRQQNYPHFTEVGNRLPETAKDACLLSDRAMGQTQARLAPKPVPEYQTLLLLEAWCGRDSCACWRRGSPRRPPEMPGRKGRCWLDSQQSRCLMLGVRRGQRVNQGFLP